MHPCFLNKKIKLRVQKNAEIKLHQQFFCVCKSFLLLTWQIKQKCLFLTNWSECGLRSLASCHSAPVSSRLCRLRSSLQRRSFHILSKRSREMWRNDPLLLLASLLCQMIRQEVIPGCGVRREKRRCEQVRNACCGRALETFPKFIWTRCYWCKQDYKGTGTPLPQTVTTLLL